MEIHSFRTETFKDLMSVVLGCFMIMMAAKVVMEVAVEVMLRVEFRELWERCPNTVQFLFNSSVVCVHP